MSRITTVLGLVVLKFKGGFMELFITGSDV